MSAKTTRELLEQAKRQARNAAKYLDRLELTLARLEQKVLGAPKKARKAKKH